MTTIAAEGNGHTDLGKPTFDDSSPDYPVDANGDPADARPRTIDNSCKSMPTEADGVIGVTSVGPRGRKAYYSDYGLEQADVAAPGGDALRHGRRLAQDREHDPRRLPVAGSASRTATATACRHRRRPASRPRPAVIKQGGAYYQ